MRLLLIEDDTKIASFVVKGLEEGGFSAWILGCSLSL